ncbi:MULTISPECIES: esterase/lipase family protein [unclassified Gordonia (in: high G+C Gram-positive bacteria)]|uniref:esterase/lipase family protein n=1 Tax=unclassified Gordonia (in: high G+C Gram-positive bacteria) TaxID=2657482 RepID=UPI000FA20061|nr:MAG: alpha/beta fold hydrolase [Gordonia sp. (in: high G+C Gram-positive bacteria)]
MAGHGRGRRFGRRSTGTRRSVRAVLLAIAGGLTIALAAAPLAGAAPRYPEDFNFFSGIPYELSNPGGSLPGTNNPRCKPSAAHPRPVVLVHGTGGGQQTNWGAYGGFLANEGYCVYALTYGALPLPWPLTALGGMGAQEQSAQQLKVFIDGVLAATGAKTVDLVGHSQGTLMPSYYLKHLGGATKVTNYVSLAPLWRGSGGALMEPVSRFIGRLGAQDKWVPVCAACGQMMPGSAFLDKVWSGGSPYVKGINYTNISTRYDEFVIPYISGQLPAQRPGENVRNIVVQDTCASDYSDHLAIAGSRRAAYMVLNALDPQRHIAVPCMFVPPLFG